MLAVSSIAILFLIFSLCFYFYEAFYSLGPIGEGLKEGLLATSLYLFAVHYFFVSGIIWLGVASVIVATLLVIKNIL